MTNLNRHEMDLKQSILIEQQQHLESYRHSETDLLKNNSFDDLQLKKQSSNAENVIPQAIGQQDQDLSDIEADKLEENKMKKLIDQQNLKLRADNKVVVGTGFNMDVTEFFQFQKKKAQKPQDQQSIFDQISGSRLAWILLLYSVASGSVVPGWIMSVKATKFLRKSWRFFMQALLVIPFALYEKRTANEETKKKYEISYIFNPQNLKKPYFSSFATSFWFTIVLTCFEWTSISHAIVLGSLSNFFLSIGRYFRKSSHDLQSGGQVLVICGIILVIEDSFGLKPEYASPDELDVINNFYFGKEWYQRCLADLAALFVSYVMSQFSKYTSDLKNYYPPFLGMLLVNVFNSIHLTFCAFFFNGATFDFDSFWGLFSIFTQQHFSGFMFMAIFLSFGQMISLVMISRMFPDPIIPALAMTLEPIFASLIVQLTGVQCLPGPIAFVGYLFIIPGMLLILTGQCLFQRIKSKQEEEEKKQLALISEMKALDRLTHAHEEKHKIQKQMIKVKKSQSFAESPLRYNTK